MATWAAFVRISDMGRRVAGSDRVHADRDQRDAITRAAPPGAHIDWLAPELDVSGGLPLTARPSLRAAIEGIETGRYVGLLVAYQSRLSRNPAVDEEAWQRVERAGGRILFALDPVDNTTVDGRMLRRIKGAMHAAERDRHIEQFARLRTRVVAAGVWQHPIPLGYQRDPATRRLEPGSRAADVRALFRARAAGASIRGLAAAHGLSASGVAGLLRNRVYLGEVRQGDTVNTTAHPPLVSRDLWLQVQHPPGVAPPTKHAEVATGVVFCHGCGTRMTVGGPVDHRVYTCRGVRSGGACPARAAISVHVIHGIVDTIVCGALRLLTDPEGHAAVDVQPLRARLDAAVVERDAFLRGVEAAGLPGDVFAAGARERHDRVIAAERALATALATSDTRGVLRDAVTAWEQLGVEDRNHALRRLLVVVVRRAGGRGGGRGPRVPVEARVRVLQVGAEIGAWPDPDDPLVLWPP